MRLTRRQVYWLILTKEPFSLVSQGARLVLGLAGILGAGAALLYGLWLSGVPLWDDGAVPVLLWVAGTCPGCARRPRRCWRRSGPRPARWRATTA